MQYSMLFENSIPFYELLDMPIPFLEDIVEAQIKVREERDKAEREAMRKAQQANNSDEYRNGRKKAF